MDTPFGTDRWREGIFMKGKIGKNFRTNGYYFPVDVMPESHAESTGQKMSSQLADQRLSDPATHPRDPHLISRLAYDLAVNTAILDVVEQLIGPDILVWASGLFAKEPFTGRAIPWHRDVEDASGREGYVTAWIALSAATRENGCMQFLSGSHLSTAGQDYAVPASGTEQDGDNGYASRFTEATVVPVELRPGQVSFHHGGLLHASHANFSAVPRIALAVTYVTPDNQVAYALRDSAVLVRGRDEYGRFHPPVPAN
jgi:non-haem Fe2+, alpha-ketoglutarate-dependent halogenase